VIDIIAAVALMYLVIRLMRRPRDPKRVEGMVAQMSKVTSSPVMAIIGAGAALANPGAFIPLALKDISETNPNAVQYIALWICFAVASLLPLAVALILLVVAPDFATRVLNKTRDWLVRNGRIIAAVIVLVLAASLLRNGIAGLTS
jgi:threonine/homoserine/homoserine lactone efflux protein